MGRWRDAWRLLRGRAELKDPDADARALLESDERYIRRDEVRDLVAQMADIEIAMSTHYDKLNTLAARLRKRDQRERATNEPSESSESDPAASGAPTPRAALKAQLYRGIRA